MKLELYKDAVLTSDLLQHRLKRGDIGKLVDRHVGPDGSEGTLSRCSTPLVTPLPSPMSPPPLREDEILCARLLCQ